MTPAAPTALGLVGKPVNFELTDLGIRAGRKKSIEQVRTHELLQVGIPCLG